MSSPVFDVHQHLWPSPLLHALERRTRPPYLAGRTLTTLEGAFEVDPAAHDLDRRIAALDRAGIDVALISLQPTLGIERLPPSERAVLEHAYAAGILELVAASDGRLRALAAGTYETGFEGACVGASQLLNTSCIDDLLDALEERGGVLFVHPDRVAPPAAGAPPWWSAVAEYTADMQAACLAWIEHGLSCWPRLPVVFSLLAGGAAFQFERLASRGVDTLSVRRAPVYFETSSYGRSAVALTIATLGLDKVIHGSDYPVIPAETTLAELRRLGPATFAAVTSRNPTAVLPGVGESASSAMVTNRYHNYGDPWQEQRYQGE